MQIRTHLPLYGLKDQNFFWLSETSWPTERTEAITDEDPEVKHLLLFNSITENYDCYLI